MSAITRVSACIKTLLTIAMVCLVLTTAVAQDQEPAKDHPSIPRFPGFAMTEGIVTDFDAFEFQTGPEERKTVEGRAWHFAYRLKEGARRASVLEIARNYGNQFKARGGQVIFQVVAGCCGTVTMTMPLGDGARWLGLEIGDDGTYIDMKIIETAAMQQKVEFSSDEMAQQLAAAGRVSIHGILFDTGKADIKPESAPVLDEIAKLLKSDPSLKLLVEGHTDNVGQKAANLELSRKRAAAVKTALVSRGIDATRLTTEGYGDTRPVADNATEEGRAKNRRVELVKKAG